MITQYVRPLNIVSAISLETVGRMSNVRAHSRANLCKIGSDSARRVVRMWRTRINVKHIPLNMMGGVQLPNNRDTRQFSLSNIRRKSGRLTTELQ